MEWSLLTSPRRRILQRGALLVAGALGLHAASRSDPVAAAVTPPTGETTLELHGRAWHLHASAERASALPAKGDRMAMYGELLDEPEGEKVGEFYATCFCVDSPFGMGPLAAANVEMHTFNLRDGSIVGMGTASAGENEYAIVGGTGRYLGARGSYLARQRPLELGGDGTAEFRLTIIR